MTTGDVPLIRYIADGAKLISIPVCWTSSRTVDDFERHSEGRSLFRFDDLVVLRRMVDAHLEASAGDDQE